MADATDVNPDDGRSTSSLLRRPGEPVATRIAIVVSGYDYQIDCSRARRELGWSATGSYEAAIVAGLAQPSAVKPGSHTVLEAT